jgi:hypothetical protein
VPGPFSKAVALWWPGEFSFHASSPMHSSTFVLTGFSPTDRGRGPPASLANRVNGRVVSRLFWEKIADGKLNKTIVNFRHWCRWRVAGRLRLSQPCGLAAALADRSAASAEFGSTAKLLR